MADARLQTVESTFLEVVEKLTFMFGEQADKAELEPDGAPWVEARMRFTGGVAGSLAVIVPQALQPEIAANILGLDAAGLDTQAVLDDALREVLNVVCGHVLMALCGPDDFILETPTNAVLDDDQLTDLLLAPTCSAYYLDDEPVLLHLELA